MQRQRQQQRPRPRRRGFALVMALALTALAVASLARIASQGLALVLESRTRHETLQHDWAMLSSRLVCLDDAERLLGDSDAWSETEGLGWPYPAERAGWFLTGGVVYQALLTDEQAKLNLNTVHELEPSGLINLLSETQRDNPIPLRRNAGVPPLRLDKTRRAFENWGTLVDLPRLAGSGKAAERLVAFASRYTLGEDQRLNVRRATDDALRQTARLVLTGAEAEELVERRRGHTGDLRAWLDGVEIPSRRLVKLRRLLTDRSAAYSLWIWSDEPQAVTMASVGLTRGDRQPQVLCWP